MEVTAGAGGWRKTPLHPAHLLFLTQARCAHASGRGFSWKRGAPLTGGKMVAVDQLPVGNTEQVREDAQGCVSFRRHHLRLSVHVPPDR